MRKIALSIDENVFDVVRRHAASCRQRSMPLDHLQQIARRADRPHDAIVHMRHTSETSTALGKPNSTRDDLLSVNHGQAYGSVRVLNPFLT